MSLPLAVLLLACGEQPQATEAPPSSVTPAPVPLGPTVVMPKATCTRIPVTTQPVGATVSTSWQPGATDLEMGVTPLELCVGMAGERYRLELEGYQPGRIELAPGQGPVHMNLVAR